MLLASVPGRRKFKDDAVVVDNALAGGGVTNVKTFARHVGVIEDNTEVDGDFTPTEETAALAIVVVTILLY